MIKEEAALLGPHQSLVGIYTPSASGVGPESARLAMILLNAGLIHHVGPSGLYVKLARALAARGIAALRVDFSGVGDSSPRPDHLPAEDLAVREPAEIMDELSRRGHDGFVLCGVCSGAKHALLAAGDPRVKGLVLINQAATTADPQAAAQVSAQYYLRRSLRNPRAWRNLFTGRVKYGALLATLASQGRGLLRRGASRPKPSPLEFLLREIDPALALGRSLLVVFSDRHAEFIRLLGHDARRLQCYERLRIETYPGTDHLFTSTKAQALLVRQVCEWAQQLAGTFADGRASLRTVSAD